MVVAVLYFLIIRKCKYLNIVIELPLSDRGKLFAQWN